MRIKPIEAGEIRTHLLWFDSMGAKSSSILVETPDVKILVDPGAAEMQPSYPLLKLRKGRYREKALGKICEAAKEADTIFISHHHYDHHTLPAEESKLYEGKRLWIKDPNRWINRSQWKRARVFLDQIYRLLEGRDSPKTSPSKLPAIEDPLGSH
jgi:hypothetical protein